MPPWLRIVPLQLYCAHAEKRKKKRKERGKKTQYKSWRGRLCFSKKSGWGWRALRVYTLPFRKAHKHQASSINEDIKKALVNSTGKLSLGEGPAQTGRAGLGFPARGLGSPHSARAGSTFTAPPPAIKSWRNAQDGLRVVLYEFSPEGCFTKTRFLLHPGKKKQPKNKTKKIPKKPSKPKLRTSPPNDPPAAVPLYLQCLHKNAHMHAEKNTVFQAPGQVAKMEEKKEKKIPLKGFQAVQTHKSTRKINIKPSSSCHGSCPTLSQSEQTNLLWLLNRACSFVSHPYMYPCKKGFIRHVKRVRRGEKWEKGRRRREGA